jgi:hypothetical protein
MPTDDVQTTSLLQAIREDPDGRLNVLRVALVTGLLLQASCSAGDGPAAPDAGGLDGPRAEDAQATAEGTPVADSAPTDTQDLPRGPLWVAQELSFTSSPSAPYTSPFIDVDLYADFTHEASGRKIRRPAFWDGGGSWRVRFAPEAQGRWTYVTSGTLAGGRTDPGLVGRSGALMGDPPDPKLPTIFNRGFLRVHDNQRVLAYRDGEPFYWLSDVHWLFAEEPLGSTNYPAQRCAANPQHPCCKNPSTFKCMVDRRVAQGFTAYQTTIFGYSEGNGTPGSGVWIKGKRGVEIDARWFREVIDPRMAYIAEKGLVNAFAVDFSFGVHFKADLIKLGKYVVARYGAYPLVWQGGVEVDSIHNCGAGKTCSAAEVAALVKDWGEVMAAIDAQDSVGHHNPVTAMFWVPYPGPLFADHYRSDSWHAFFSLQSGHASKRPRSSYHEFYWRTPAKPFMDTEINFEQICVQGTNCVGREQMRRTVLRVIQAGAFAAGYGANGVWGYTVDDSHTTWDADWGHTNWYDGIDLPGAADLARAKTFYEALDWHELVPIDGATWVGYNCPGITDEYDRPITRAAFNPGTNTIRLVVVYFPAGPRCPITVHKVAAGTYKARWFDLESGVYTTTTGSPFAVSPSGDLSAPTPPADQRDYLLVLEP